MPTKYPDIATVRHHHKLIDSIGEKAEIGYLIAQEIIWNDKDRQNIERLARDAAEYVPCVLIINGTPRRHYYVNPGTDQVVEEEYIP